MQSRTQNDSRFLGASSPERPSDIAVPTLTLGNPAQLQRLVWGVSLLVWLLYVTYFIQLTSFPFQDYPNHLARAAILADLLLHGGHRFGGEFGFHFAIAPYILHDALLTALVGLLGVAGGAAVFTTLVLVSLPCALVFYMRANDLAPRARAFVVIISLYLATDWFFLMGFMAFRLALAVIIICMALADMLRRHWSRSLFIGYIVTLVLGYLTHLTSLVFFVPVLAFSSALRLAFHSTVARREILLWIPVGALLLVHFGLIATPHDAAHPTAYSYDWGTFREKVRHLNWEFERFDGRPSPVMMYTLIACIAWAAHRHLRWRNLWRPRVLEHLALAATFLFVYFILPGTYEDSTYVDVRALCMVTLFLLLAALYLPPPADEGSPFNTWPVLAVAFALASANFAYLVLHMNRNEAWLSRYRQVVAAVPAGARVLPVYTQPSQMDISPFLHAGSYITLDRGAVIPYLFSGDRGDLMKYFDYKHRPYMPDESWYKSLEYWNVSREATYEVGGRRYTWRFTYDRIEREWKTQTLVPIDWNRVACEYDYLLVMLPFREPFLEVPTKPLAYNEAAALLTVDKSACHPGVRARRTVRLPQER
jgi:hypothetical protein